MNAEDNKFKVINDSIKELEKILAAEKNRLEICEKNGWRNGLEQDIKDNIALYIKCIEKRKRLLDKSS